MEEKKNNKLNNISLIKTVMMISVVFYHSCIFYTNEWFKVIEPAQSFKIATIITRLLGTFHTQAFTMASGYIFYYLLFEKNRYTDTLVSIKKKFKRLIYPFYTTCIFWVIPFAIYFFRYTMKEIVIRYILMTSPNQLWFLAMLFWCFCIAFFFKKRIGFSIKNLVLVFLVTTILGVFTKRIGLSIFQISHGIEYFLYFYFGGYLYFYKKNMTYKKILVEVGLLVVLWICKYYLDKGNGYLFSSINYFVTPLISLVEVSTIYLLLSRFSLTFNFDNKLYKLLEENSFGIYLFHQQIIYVSIYMLNGIVLPILIVCISFVLSLLIALLLSLSLKKVKITKIAFGL